MYVGNQNSRHPSPFFYLKHQQGSVSIHQETYDCDRFVPFIFIFCHDVGYSVQEQRHSHKQFYLYKDRHNSLPGEWKCQIYM